MTSRLKRGCFALGLFACGLFVGHAVNVNTAVQQKWQIQQAKLRSFRAISGELVQVMKGQRFGQDSNNTATFRLMRPAYCYVNMKVNVDRRSRGFTLVSNMTPKRSSSEAWWPNGSHESVLEDNARLETTLDPFAGIVSQANDLRPIEWFPTEFFGQTADAFEVCPRVSDWSFVSQAWDRDAACERSPLFREVLYFRHSDGMPLGATFWQAGTGQRVETDVYRNLSANPRLTENDFPIGTD